ncbi:mannose-1-phosphate guanyltransferase beta-like [Schistocerca gregaria]|uniref:mannose-1-phosphate guanyltransferase beta-like n=1 Tax=Schistocerca gregaria TaxID=7010 RepID=UPI00211DB80B|nr:mannose-1-phosphate guanyltransferase beta-like [Schistocerca gregaria]
MSNLKAVILVGGYGTRLRPLTLSQPKPIIPFCNKPLVVYQIEALAKIGVTTVVLAISYKPEEMAKALEPYESKLSVKIKYSRESIPLGTAGPLSLMKKLLQEDSPDSPFFVLNSDIVSEFPFSDLLKFHYAHGKEGTIMVTTVTNPSKYGVVVYDQNSGKIDKFVEKPKNYVGNKINAGLYIFNPSILSQIEVRPTSLEKEIFPAMAASGQLYAMELHGFWMDVGQPKDYLIGMSKYLSHLQENDQEVQTLASGPNIIGPVLIHPSAKISPDSLIGPYVSIGPECFIETGVRLKHCTLMNNVHVEAHSWIKSSIIGWHCHIGKWVRMDNATVLGMDVSIHDEVFINGAKVLPHKCISESIIDPNAIIM